MKIRKIFISLLLIFSFTLAGCDFFDLSDDEEVIEKEVITDFTGMTEEKVIMHAGGAMGGKNYLNIQEAVQYHYIRGSKFFEVDLRFSKDNKLVGIHEYEYVPENLTYQEYIDRGVKVGSTTYKIITYEFLISAMQEYPDLYFVIDTKETDEIAVYDFLIREFKKVDETLLNRVIPQIYYRSHYYALEQLFQFPQYIYTLYKTEDNAAQILSFLEQTPRVTTITMNYLDLSTPVGSFKRDFYNKTFTNNVVDMGKKLYFHTIDLNVSDILLSYSRSSIKKIFEEYRNTGIYTDNVNVAIMKDILK